MRLDLDLPHGEHVEVAVGKRKALIFYTGQPKAERQDGEREGEEAGDDEEQSPQSKTAPMSKRTSQEEEDKTPPEYKKGTESVPLLLVLVAEVEEA